MQKTLSFHDIFSLARELDQTLMGAQLQNIWTSDETLVFDLYLNENLYLVLRLNQLSPGFWLTRQIPSLKKKQLPVGLFLSAHAKNLRWRHTAVSAEKGRVLEIHLGNSLRTVKIEIILVPRSVNLSVTMNSADESKQIHFRKPRELPVSSFQDPEESTIRLWDLETLLNPSVPAQTVGTRELSIEQQEQAKQRWLQKKQQALSTLLEQVQAPDYLEWQKLGEAVKAGLTDLKLSPDNWSENIQKELSSSKNLLSELDTIFSRAKHYKQKYQGQLERIELLKKEIEQGFSLSGEGQSKKPQLLKKAEARGRQFEVDGFMAVIGKSAQDNLNILRKARPHDLWIHLKDYPGSYGVISVNKNQSVPDSVLYKVAEWVAETSLGKQFSLVDKLEILLCECRHVKPIKGDKLGRVTYHGARHFFWRRS